MKSLKNLLVILLMLSLVGVQPGAWTANTLATSQQRPDPETAEGLATDVAEDLVNEIFVDNVASLAGPSCNLFAQGVDLVNFFNDGQWSILDGLLEITVLFRNESWRKLIWDVTDRREEYVKKLVELRKTKCLLGFREVGSLEAEAREKAVRQQQALDQQIAELEAKIDYFGIQRYNLLSFEPSFGDGTQFDPESFTLPKLETDKIFYFLLTDVVDIDSSQLAKEGARFGKERWDDFELVLGNLPDTCFATINVIHEMLEYMAYGLRAVAGGFQDSLGNQYKSYRDFLERNQSAIVRAYSQKYCAPGDDPKQQLKREPSSSEVQFEKFLLGLNEVLKTTTQQMLSNRSQLLQLQQQIARGQAGEGDQERLQQLLKRNGEFMAMIDYYNLVLAKVGGTTSNELSKIFESMSSFAEAVLGIETDRKGRKSSRISLAQRFEDSRERNLRNLCSRLEKMYRQTGRSVSDLPLIGEANGSVYCAARPECEGVDLLNTEGVSEGSKTLGECSGFLFNRNELGVSQQAARQIREDAEDISELIEQKSYNQLLQNRSIHLTSLRQRYQEAYGAQEDETAILEQNLENIAKDLYNAEHRQYDPRNQSTKTHYGLMRKIYADMWTFLEAQAGSCQAPENPQEES